MIKQAKYIVQDIKYSNGVFIISVKIKAGKYSFHKAFKLEPRNGVISAEEFRANLKEAILKELKTRKAIEPIQRMTKDELTLEL